MGILGGTKIYVSSVAVNLAGDYTKVQSYLKNLVLGNIIATNRPQSMGDLIQSGYRNSPGVSLRRFFNWAGEPGNYDDIGVPSTSYRGYGSSSLRSSVQASLIAQDYDVIRLGVVEGGPGDPNWFGLKHLMFLGYPISTRFDADVDRGTNELVLTLRSDGTVIRTPVAYDAGKTYIYYIATVRDLSTSGSTAFTDAFIYEQGSGLDENLEMVLPIVGTYGYEFYPIIPIRADNTFVTSSTNASLAAQATKGYKRVFNEKIKRMVDTLAENEKLDEIDYAYVVFGVPVNTKEPTCKEYLYRFFEYLRFKQTSEPGDLDDFVTEYNAYRAATADWLAWDAGGRVGPAPAVPTEPGGKLTGIRIKSNRFTEATYDFEIVWRHIEESYGTGLKKPDAKAGDIWFEPLGEEPESIILFGNEMIEDKTFYQRDEIMLHWQETSTSWRSLKLVGFLHRNYIYRAKYVETRLRDAVTDPDEGGFIIPLHRGICDSMGLVNFTQMTAGCCNLVINCYKVVKTSFLTGLITIVFIIAAIVITIYFPPAAGLLGPAATVGAAIGLTGVLAVIAGTLINMLAAMIVMKIITKVSVMVFGDKWGQIIGAVVGFVAVSVGTGLQNGMSLGQIWGSMGSATNLLQLTNAVGSGISGYVRSAMADLSKEMEAFNTEMDKKTSELEELYAKNIGYANAVFDPLSLTDTQFGNYAETPSQFLTRTLLTGSDIADLSMGMIDSFGDMTLTTELPTNF